MNAEMLQMLSSVLSTDLYKEGVGLSIPFLNSLLLVLKMFSEG